MSVFHDKTKDVIQTMRINEAKLVDAKRCCEHCKLVALGIETEIEQHNKELRKKALRAKHPVSPSSVQVSQSKGGYKPGNVKILDDEDDYSLNTDFMKPL